jgi:hypothetical protein
MYYEVQLFQKEGLSYCAIAQSLVMNQRTIIKYLAMSKAEYETFLKKRIQGINYLTTTSPL